MKRQLIEDFLNLPGIEGIALIDGQSRSYACGLPSVCDAGQHHLLAQGIQQIIETTPPSLESFNFFFGEHQVYLYKIERGMTLLVLSSVEVSADYAKYIAQLTRFMRTDFDAVAEGLLTVASSVLALEDGVPMASSQDPSPLGLSPEANGSSEANGQPPAVGITATVEEIMTAMNQLSDFTNQYLGKFIVANHWRTNRPSESWLEGFQISSSGLITLERNSQLGRQDTVAEQELTWIRSWVAGFSQRCAKIIRDYPELVQSQALDQRQWQILFDSNPHLV